MKRYRVRPNNSYGSEGDIFLDADDIDVTEHGTVCLFVSDEVVATFHNPVFVIAVSTTQGE